jgi:hypothetical protein
MLVVGVIAGLCIVVGVVIGAQCFRDGDNLVRQAVGAAATRTGSRHMPPQDAVSTKLARKMAPAWQTTNPRRSGGSGDQSTGPIGTASPRATPGHVEAPSSQMRQKFEQLPNVRQAKESLVAAQKQAADVMEKAFFRLHNG